jgi:formylmethanofuran dehydrogenase subunit A
VFQVVTENEKLRLDNKVEQSNLKSMTKSKNDEIRGISQRLRNLEKGAEADCG